jgi:hypothetical protein
LIATGNANLTSLHDINQTLQSINGVIDIRDTPIISHLLGVFFIKGTKALICTPNTKCYAASIIVNRHILKSRSGLLPCQKELIEAGLEDFAQI